MLRYGNVKNVIDANNIQAVSSEQIITEDSIGDDVADIEETSM